MQMSNSKVQSVPGSEDAAKIREQHSLLSLRLCQAMILIGEKIASQREFIKRAKLSRSSAFNVIRADNDARPPSAKTMSKLAACCMKESPVPWSSEVSKTIADSLLPALRSPSAWRDWREKNLALVAFADSVAASETPHLDQETISGGAVVRWLVGLGDYCDGSDQSVARYREACDRLETVLRRIDEGGPFVKWVQIRALHDRWVVDFNSVPEGERASQETKKRFEPFFWQLCDYIEAGTPTLIAEHIYLLVFAIRFNMVEHFPLLRFRLEEAWRRHNGGENPDYTDTKWFDSDFDPFRKWLRLSVEQRRVTRDMPTSIPSPVDRGEFRFVAADADGHEWEWNDDGLVWVARQTTADAKPKKP